MFSCPANSVPMQLSIAQFAITWKYTIGAQSLWTDMIEPREYLTNWRVYGIKKIAIVHHHVRLEALIFFLFPVFFPFFFSLFNPEKSLFQEITSALFLLPRCRCVLSRRFAQHARAKISCVCVRVCMRVYTYIYIRMYVYIYIIWISFFFFFFLSLSFLHFLLYFRSSISRILPFLDRLKTINARSSRYCNWSHGNRER